MVLSFKQKEDKVKSLSEFLADSTSIVFADYQGTTVEDLTLLRKEANNSNCAVYVIRNRLFKIAVKGTAFECASELCSGPTIVVFSYQEPSSGARIFKKFAKNAEYFELKGFVFEGNLFYADEIDRLASLPTKEEAITKFAVVIKAPVTKIATTLNALPIKLLNALTAVKDSKGN